MEVANHQWPCLCSITRECMPNKLEAHSAQTWLEQDVASRILTQFKQVAYHQDRAPKNSLPLCIELPRTDVIDWITNTIFNSCKRTNHTHITNSTVKVLWHWDAIVQSLEITNGQTTTYIPIYDQMHNTKVRMTESVKSKSQAVCMSGHLSDCWA